jgi:AcrR family transcriptional regulator
LTRAHSAATRGPRLQPIGHPPDLGSVEVYVLYEGLWADVQPESSLRLLMAALEAFATYGFAGSTTRQIAERAGMSPAGLYVHYRSKADLLFAIARTGHERALAEVTTATERAIGAPAKLRAFVETFVIWHARFHTLARVCQYELRSLGGDQLEAITRLRRAFQWQVEAILQEGVIAGDFDVGDLRGTARTILSLGIDVARWFRGQGSLLPQDLAALNADLVLRMVRRTPDQG